MVDKSDTVKKKNEFNIELNKIKQISIRSLNKLIEMIDDNKLTGSNKIEFFDTYEDDIIEMLENKIKTIKGDKK